MSHPHSYVLGLLRASAADPRRRALSNEQARIARMTTDRTLRNRALLIIQRLQGMTEARRRSFVEAATRQAPHGKPLCGGLALATFASIPQRQHAPPGITREGEQNNAPDVRAATMGGDGPYRPPREGAMYRVFKSPEAACLGRARLRQLVSRGTLES
jgi:hypothetical protein